MVVGTWVVFAALAAGVSTLYLVSRIYEHRAKPGARWFLASLVCQAVASVAYAAALLTFDPTVRWVLEVFTWTTLAGLAVFFLAFALEYTGRTRRFSPWTRLATYAVPGVVVLVVVTNPLHQFAWVGFEVEAVGGLAGASYRVRPWLLAAATVVVSLPVAGSLLLFETVFSYGQLYRREAVAVGLSVVPPVGVVLAWLYGLGPVPELNFIFVAFLPHVAIDAYAFVRSDMFEFHPATRRAGERAAIDDLGNPVVIVDEQDRVVTLNDAASAALGVDKRAALTNRLDDLLGEDELDVAAEDERVTIRTDDGRRTYNATSTPLTDGTGTHVGHTVVLQDVTRELQREQRLEVLNRVLRHNLRNDMNVVHGFTSTANDAVDDEDVSAMLDTVERKADELVALSDKARAIERIVAREPRPTTVALDELLADVVDELRDEFPDTAVTIEAPTTTVETDEETVRVVAGALLENALQHGCPDPDDEVRLVVDRTERSVSVRVADDGPGVPEQELAVIDSGHETDLEHSTGLGLWLASWGARRLGGDLSFDVDGGTVVTLTLPAGETAERRRRRGGESASRAARTGEAEGL